jgi:hypothetical protein
LSRRAVWISLTAAMLAILLVLIIAATGRPTLTDGLPARWDAASREFNRRVVERFPLGSSAAEMRQELHRQGFVPTDRTTPGPAWRLDRSDLACRIGAYVEWRVDAADRLVAIGGRYGEEGCL